MEADEYRRHAIDCLRIADETINVRSRALLIAMAQSWMHLAQQAEKNLTTVHSGFLTKGDAHGFLAKSPTFYSLYYESGRREYTPAGPKEGVFTTYDAETFSAPDCLTVVGWYRKALEMCGVTGVKIKEEECRALGGAVCRYRVKWD